MFYYHLRNELWKLFGKKRTYIGFGAFLLAQNAMLLAFRFTRWQTDMQRMLLSRPISRLRLLLVKWLAAVIFCTVLVIVLGGTALCFARFWFPWRGLFVSWPGMVFNALSAAEGFKLYLGSHLFMAINAAAVSGLAFMFSCFNMKPAAATILSLSFLFINLVMENIPFFDRYHQWFLPYHFRIWLFIYAQPIPWERIAESLCILLAFNLTTFLVGAAAFQARDIKS